MLPQFLARKATARLLLGGAWTVNAYGAQIS
jgi:hypothetical protein